MLEAISLVLKKMKFVRSDKTLYDDVRDKGRIHLLLDVLKSCKVSGLKKQRLKKSITELWKDSENEHMTSQVAFKQNSYESMVKEVAQVSLSPEAFEKF